MRCVLLVLMCVFSLGSSMANNIEKTPDEWISANQRLNTVYHQIFHQLSNTEQEKLKKAQRQWMIYRDLDCKINLIWDCMIDRTNNRVSELKKIIDYRDKSGSSTVHQEIKYFKIKQNNGSFNAIYHQLLKRLWKESQRKALVQAQEQWVLFAQLDCAWAFPEHYEYCLQDRTNSRYLLLCDTVYFAKDQPKNHNDIW